MREHIRPHVHESKAYLHFGENGLSPYWTLRNFVIHELDGHGEVTTEIDGEPWHVEIGYSDSAIAPRPSDSIQRDVLRDWELHLEGPGEAKAHFQIRARYDDMRGPDGDSKSIPWPGGEGLDIFAQSSNVSLDRVPWLLRKAIGALADDAGVDINASYLRQPLPSSNITTVEYYVRLRRQYAMKLVRSDGVMYRLMMLLAEEEGIEWIYKADNTEIVGHRHAFDLPPSALEELGPDLSAGCRLKTYHPKHVRSEETDDDPLSSPKYGVAFHRSIDGESRPWNERDELRRELEDILVNTLEWADVPTEPDPTTYVSDTHFDVEASEVDVGRRSDPTPALEAQQESMLLHVLDDLTPTGKDVLEEVATDGGRKHYRDLAKATDSSVSTIYRVLDEMNEVVKSDRGMVKFTSEKIRQEIVGMVERLDELKESTADRVAELANIDLRSRADSALEQWMAKYGSRLVNVYEGREAQTLRFDAVLSELRSLQEPHVERVLEAGLDAWTSTWRDALTFKEFRVEADIRGGTDVEGRRVGSIIGW
jgi:hypothetical protein